MIKATTTLCVALTLAMCAPAAAQSGRDARLIITVVDSSGGVIPGADVTAAGQDNATRVTAARGKTTDKGVVTIDNLLPGVYQIQAEFAAFDPGILKDVRIKSGDNKHVIVLPLKRIEESVAVSRDPVMAAADPRGGSMMTQLTREEIDALSDDPTEMMQQLLDMAGGSAVFKIDSFVGGALPPKALIKSIHIVRDTFPAENHSDESDEIEIITQPGAGPIQGSGTSRLRDGSMSGRNPFVSINAPERTRNFEGNVGGALVQHKSSFSLSLSKRNQFDTPIATYATAAGKQSVLLGARPNDSWSLMGLLDYALTVNHVLRSSYEQSGTTRSNLGVGGFDLAERAYSTTAQSRQLRVQETGPFGRRFYANSRLQLRSSDTGSHAVLEAPTVRVLDGVTTGGAQVTGGRRQREIELASDIDYLRSIHAVRLGVLIDAGRYRSDDSTNYLGTYIFTSPAALAVGTPAQFIRRIGDPHISYQNLQAGAYVQDDIRIRKNLTLSPGLRYEAQTHLHDMNDVGPRVGLTWAPAKSGSTTVRASYGVFYNWLSSNVYDQTLRVDGLRQRDLNVVNPTYPDAGAVGSVTAADRYILGANVNLERYTRLGLALDEALSPKLRFTLNYALSRYGDQLRGMNLNAPVNGVRPDALFANVIQVVSDASTHVQELNPGVTINLAGGVRGANQARWNPLRTTMRFQYRYRRTFNNSDGAFTPPPGGTLATEWGPARSDSRHRVRASITTTAVKNLNAQLSLDGTSGAPYTITTGLDDNGDGIFNDRPVSVGRDTVRLPWRTTLSANVGYLVPIGRPRAGDRGNAAPYGVVLNLSIANLTNRYNYTGFSGVKTSQYFLQPTAISNPRQIDFTMRLSF